MAGDSSILIRADLPLKLFIRGKVRDTFDLGDALLIIATDRISAFDFVLPNGIPNKGRVLNQLSAFWFEKTAGLIPNHMLESVKDARSLGKYLPSASKTELPSYLNGRSMVVKKAERIPIECVVRGYISGSAWSEYKKSGTVNGVKMPSGLVESQEFPEPIFTPTTKAETGHDMPLSPAELRKAIKPALADELAKKSLEVYALAREYAKARGIIIADTKFEFGLDKGELIIIDEMLTPDSSRFWDMKLYRIGLPQPSYDKQPLRDWLVASGWNKEPPVPVLPPEVVESTSKRYQEAYLRLTGKKLS
jgi:phosphoribosylaminoimidazole-succinocarboxamide synthase